MPTRINSSFRPGILCAASLLFAVCTCFFINGQAREKDASTNVEVALHEKSKFHPRQWVDEFRSNLYKRGSKYLLNPTHGSGWIVQILPISTSFATTTRLDLKHPPTPVGGISTTSQRLFGRPDLKYPPTAVGGIWTVRAKPVEVKNDADARAAFLEAYTVLMHPRCVNCHPAGDAPLQGNDSRPHTFFRLRRGADGKGVFAVKCTNCHQAQNQPGLHMPPGAPFPLKNGVEDQAHRGEPRWHLPPAATPMVFEKRSPGQLCRQLLDKRQNGGLTPEQLVQHVDHDPLVLWGWNPGEGRTVPPLSHAAFVQKVREWVEKGGACPK